jgi:hypothetical protein
MQQTNESVRTIFFNAPDIMSEFPFKVLGSKFQGIKCLKGTDLCGECNIEHRSGVNLAIIKNFILSEELA